VTGKRTKLSKIKSSEPTPDQVREFLKANPDFLAENPDILLSITPPERNLGEGVIDFQNHMVKHLQKDSKALEDKYSGLVDFCRDNMSVQAQVHHAALRLIRARTLEQLLEVLTLDLVSLFDVDVVRLALESETARVQDDFQGDQSSGIVFIPRYTVDNAMGKKKSVLLVADTQDAPPAGFDQIFVDCTDLIRSCALLRLKLDLVDKHVILAFGVRYKDRFHPGQGVELLNFLSQIVAHQLDVYLDELTV
jgi:uncharacterized protein YigA (DUF484 family)